MTASSALAVALDERTTTPSVTLASYDAVECTSSSAGGVIATKDTPVLQNSCTALPTTLSFKGFLINACSAQKSPVVTVYSKTGCSGTTIVEMGLTATSQTCFEAQLGGAKSAMFTCTSA